MKLLGLNKNIAKIQVEHLEDLWHLSHLIEPDDTVKSKTERKIKIGSSDSAQKVAKKTITLTIAVERVEFEKYGDNLRVLGTVTSENDLVPLGAHHTITLELNSIFTLEKKQFLSYHKKLLDEATRPISNPILLVLHDRENAIFAQLTNQGIKYLSTLKGDVQKKDVEEKSKGNFYSNVALEINTLSKAHGQIILASPSFFKEYVHKLLSEDIRKKTVLATVADVSKNSISELLKKPELSKALQKDKNSQEELLLEKVLTSISQESACYGLDEVENATNLGAVSELLVTDTFIRKLREVKEKYSRVEAMMKTVESQQGSVFIVSSEEVVKKIDALGGIVAILRWKI